MEKKDIGIIVGHILDRHRNDVKNGQLYEWLSGKTEWFSDPEKFYIMAGFEFASAVGECVRGMHNTNDWVLVTIWTDYDFFENNVREMCKRFYGHAFSTDRARHIISCAVKWRLTGELPTFDPENYRHPKTWTPSLWMDFVESLCHLRYGRPEKYIHSLLDLFAASDKPDPVASFDELREKFGSAFDGIPDDAAEKIRRGEG